MNVLSIDPGASCGYALFNVDIDNNSADLYSYGHFDIEVDSEYVGDRCLQFFSVLDKMIKSNDIQHIAVEDYMFNRKRATGSDVNVAYRTMIWYIARLNNLPYTIVSVGSWKKFIAGKVNPSKELKEEYGKELAKKIHIQKALWEKYQIKFPNHSISNKTGKPIKPRMDYIDAIAQGIYFIRSTYPIGNISVSVQERKDIENCSWKIFKYDV